VKRNISISTGCAEIYVCVLAMCGTLRVESWTLNTDIYKILSAFKRKVLRRLFGGIKVNENWIKRYKKEIIQLFGNLVYFISSE